MGEGKVEVAQASAKAIQQFKKPKCPLQAFLSATGIIDNLFGIMLIILQH